MIHPDTELKFIDDEIGHGVVAKKLIPAGTIIWTLDKLDRELTPEEFYGLDPVCRPFVENHTFRNRKGNFILCWDIGKYINHSFKPNCMATAYNFEIAIRDIQAGEQLTDDYGFLNILEPFRASDEGTERKVVYPDDLVRFHQQWDKQVEQVFSKITEVTQPLKPIVSNEIWEKIEMITAGKILLDSILNNYYQKAQ